MNVDRSDRWSTYHWLVVFAVLLCALLSVIDIQRPSYWIDEKISVDIATPASPQQVIAKVIDSERRPPAYHLSLWLWMRLVGVNERMARLHSVLWAILFVPAAFQLARQFASLKAATLTAFITALAPVTISYGQTIRYYSMVAALSALSFALFFAVIRKPKGRKPWIAYILSTLALLYTDYPAYGVILAQNALAILWWIYRPEHKPHHPHWKWLGVQAIMAILILLWFPVVLLQRTRDFGAADLSNSVSGALLRIAYPFYAWLAGETIFPWAVLGVLGALVGGVLLIIGLLKLTNAHRVTWIIAFGLPCILAQILLSTVATDSPFVNAPARSMACAGLLFTLEGAGLATFNRRWLAGVLAGAILISHTGALMNYYRGVNFINTVYNTPAREVAQAIALQAHGGDAVITESDSMVDVYLPAELRNTSFYADQAQQIKDYLTAHPHAAVWQVIMGRDRTRNEVSATLGDWLTARYTPSGSSGFAEQSVTYRALKSRLIGRTAYQYRLVLDHYQPR
jgi:4-amino-4-deoxy-L-arabinose transferase-like glycosyltransferase